MEEICPSALLLFLLEVSACMLGRCINTEHNSLLAVLCGQWPVQKLLFVFPVLDVTACSGLVRVQQVLWVVHSPGCWMVSWGTRHRHPGKCVLSGRAFHSWRGKFRSCCRISTCFLLSTLLFLINLLSKDWAAISSFSSLSVFSTVTLVWSHR